MVTGERGLKGFGSQCRYEIGDDGGDATRCRKRGAISFSCVELGVHPFGREIPVEELGLLHGYVLGWNIILRARKSSQVRCQANPGQTCTLAAALQLLGDMARTVSAVGANA